MVKSTSRRVLVVDDDPVFRKIAESALIEAGYEVICAPDVSSAQAIFQSVDAASLACALVDYGLPGCNGMDLLEWLNARYPTLAAVMITASPEQWLLERSMKARVCAFLGKPLGPSDIRRAAASATDISSQRRAFAEMRHQVAQAGKLQKAMLERMLRTGDVSLEYRFHPRYDGSGDFLAYHRLPGGEDVFLMSDAAGHDLHALAQSSYFHGMLSGMLKSGQPLPEALREYNRTLLDEPAGQVSSLSVSALQVHPGSGCVSAWNYGAPPPVFVDGQGWVRTMGTQASPPLGWFEDSEPAVDRAGIPNGPVWMWTDGLDDLAEALNASSLSVAYALLQARAGEPPQFVSEAQDDVLVARIWPGASAQTTAVPYAEPLLSEDYGPETIANIDRVQEHWVRSLQLALPSLSDSVRYDLVLCGREAVLNALKYGCSMNGKARFQVLYEPSRELLRARVWDPGSGYDFDFAEHAAHDRNDPVEDHRGLLLMHAHSPRVSVGRGGAEVTMEFQLHPKPEESKKEK